MFNAKPLASNAVGIGLRAQHYQQILTTRPALGWLEVHSENYFAPGGQPLAMLMAIRQHYPISLHGVGLSLGSVDALAKEHLLKLKQLIQQLEPCLISEHLAWGSLDGRYYHDLLPLPYTPEALGHMVNRVQQVQDYLGRQILIENISSYSQFTDSCIPEPEFIAALAKQSGCGILLDINNIYVNAHNFNLSATDYWRAIPTTYIQEIHLAGHSQQMIDQHIVLIDTHDQPVAANVWQLYRQAISDLGPKPTLIEWDAQVPDLDILLAEARQADIFLHQCSDHVAII